VTTTEINNLISTAARAGYQTRIITGVDGPELFDFELDGVVLYIVRTNGKRDQARIYNRATGEDAPSSIAKIRKIIEEAAS
jgi:hypothetical protein